MRARAIVIENVDYANTLGKVGHFSNAVYADWVENTRQELEESRRVIARIEEEEHLIAQDMENMPITITNGFAGLTGPQAAACAAWREHERRELEESRRAIRQIADEERARREDIRQWLEAD